MVTSPSERISSWIGHQASLQRLIGSLRQLVTAGTERLDPIDARHSAITNGLLLSYLGFVAPYIPVYLLIGLTGMSAATCLVCAGYLAGLAVNRRGTYRAFVAARVIFLTTYALGAGFFSGMLGHGTGMHLLLYIGACLPFLICDLRERAVAAYGVAVCVVTMLAVELGREILFPPPIMTESLQLALYVAIMPTTFAAMFAAVFLFARAAFRAEREVAQRHRDVKRLLDTIDQGLLTVDPRGNIGGEYSTVLETWFGRPAPDQKIWSYLGAHDPSVEDVFELGWRQIEEDIFPLEVAIEQLPKQLDIGGRRLALLYRPIEAAGSATQISIILTDITADIARARSERLQRETMAIFEELARTRGPFLDFIEEGSAMVRQIASDDTDPATLFRVIHTLKGNCGMMAIESVADRCHEVEAMFADGGAPQRSDCESIIKAWDEITDRVERLLGKATDRLDVSQRDYAEICAAVARRADHDEIASLLESWRLEGVQERLNRLAEHARSLALRREKGTLAIEVADNGVRLDGSSWAPFWSALVHAVRNSVEHGIETPEERVESGKDGTPHLKLSAVESDAEVIVAIEDDGRGIDWESIRRKASEKSLPHVTRDDLVAALFADGVSTRDEVSMFSGRGVGMAAIRDACESLGGTIEVESRRGEGTRLAFLVPRHPRTKPRDHVP